MTTEISVMYGSEKVKHADTIYHIDIYMLFVRPLWTIFARSFSLSKHTILPQSNEAF